MPKVILRTSACPEFDRKARHAYLCSFTCTELNLKFTAKKKPSQKICGKLSVFLVLVCNQSTESPSYVFFLPWKGHINPIQGNPKSHGGFPSRIIVLDVAAYLERCLYVLMNAIYHMRRKVCVPEEISFLVLVEPVSASAEESLG